MKYSLRSLMIVVLVAPPVLAWAVPPLYRWLAATKVKESSVTTQTKGPPITFHLGFVTESRKDGPTPIVDLDFEFHQTPAP